jgi:hypothetical protein
MAREAKIKAAVGLSGGLFILVALACVNGRRENVAGN